MAQVPGWLGRRVLGFCLVGMSVLTVVMVVNAVAGGRGATGTAQAAGAIVCPSPLDAIPAVPGTLFEVNAELANLDRQLAEANTRLASAAGAVDEAILEPLASERAATLDRIEVAIGRLAAKPDGLERFAACELAGQPAAEPPQPSVPPTTTTTTVLTTAPVTTMTATATITATPPPPPPTTPPPPRRIACPDPVPAIAPIPFQVRAEVNSELANLDRQLADANAQLARAAGQSDEFIRNTILMPLAGKRAATLDRIEIAIDRVAPRPQLERFIPCVVR